jgi:hypothetical protein
MRFSSCHTLILLLTTLCASNTRAAGASPLADRPQPKVLWSGYINSSDATGLRIVLKRRDHNSYWNGRAAGWGIFDPLLSLHRPNITHGRWQWQHDFPDAQQLCGGDFILELRDINRSSAQTLATLALRTKLTRPVTMRVTRTHDATIEYCYTAGSYKRTLSTGNSMNEVVKTLEAAAKDLFFISETDAPLEVVFWPISEGVEEAQLDEKLVAQMAQAPVDAKIEAVELDEFFAPVTEVQDWHNAEEKDEVERFQQLVKILKAQLQGAKAYRIGKTKITVYVVGKVPAGIAGIRTVIVES